MKDERGSGTVLMVLVTAMLILLMSGLAILGIYLLGSSQARAGADLVALSAASTHARGGDGCHTARSLASQNQVRLVECDITGDQLEFVVSVEVEVTFDSEVPVGPIALRARAYAGQVWDGP